MSKESSTKRVLFNSGIYSITSVLQKAIGFLLLPLYTIYLTPSDYGITGVVNSLTQVLSLLFTLSLNGAVQRYYYKYKDDLVELRKFYGTIVLFIFINSIVLSALIIIFNDVLIQPFIKNIEFYPYIFVGIITVVVNPIYTIYQTLLKTMEKAKSFAINSILNFGVLILLNIFLIVVLKLGALGQLLSYMMTGIIFGIYSIYTLYRNNIIIFDFKKKYLVEALKYSIPLLPHNLSTQISNLVSRLFLNNMVSVASVGLFNIASQFMLIIDTIHFSVNSAYIPWFYNLMSKGNHTHKQIIKFADVLSKFYLIISIAMVLYIKEVIQIFTNESYLEAWLLIPLMVIAYQIRSIYLFYVNTLFYNTKATRYIFIATLGGSILSVILTSLLTSYFRLYTPAIVLLIQWIFTTVVVVSLSKKIEPVSFKLNKMIGYVLFLILVIIVGLYFDLQDPYGPITFYKLIYKGVILLISAVIIINKDIKSITTITKDIVEQRKEKT